MDIALNKQVGDHSKVQHQFTSEDLKLYSSSEEIRVQTLKCTKAAVGWHQWLGHNNIGVTDGNSGLMPSGYESWSLIDRKLWSQADQS